MKHRSFSEKKHFRKTKSNRERRSGDVPEKHKERKVENKTPSLSFLAALEAQREAEAQRANLNDGENASSTCTDVPSNISLPGMVYDPVKNRHFAIGQKATNDTFETFLKPIIDRDQKKKNISSNDSERPHLSLVQMMDQIKICPKMRVNLNSEWKHTLLSKLREISHSQLSPSSFAYTSPIAYASNCHLLFCGGSDGLVKVFYIGRNPNSSSLHSCYVLKQFPNRIIDLKWYPTPVSTDTHAQSTHVSHTPDHGVHHVLGHLAVVCMGEGELTGSLTLLACTRQKGAGIGLLPNAEFSLRTHTSETEAETAKPPRERFPIYPLPLQNTHKEPLAYGTQHAESMGATSNSNDAMDITELRMYREAKEERERFFAHLNIQTTTRYQLPSESGTVWGMVWMDQRTVLTLGMQGGHSYLLEQGVDANLREIASCRNKSDVFAACLFNTTAVREHYRGKKKKKLHSFLPQVPGVDGEGGDSRHHHHSWNWDEHRFGPATTRQFFDKKRTRCTLPSPLASTLEAPTRYPACASVHRCVLLGQRVGGVTLWDTRVTNVVPLFRSTSSIIHISEYPFYDRSPYAYLVADVGSSCTLKDSRMWDKSIWTLPEYSNDQKRLGLDVDTKSGMIVAACKDQICRIWDSNGQFLSSKKIYEYDHDSYSIKPTSPKHVLFLNTCESDSIETSSFSANFTQTQIHSPLGTRVTTLQKIPFSLSAAIPSSSVIRNVENKWIPRDYNCKYLLDSNTIHSPVISIASGAQISLLMS